jgi:ATPase subunit of ABC transporter with duplicated ATPase domains
MDPQAVSVLLQLLTACRQRDRGVVIVGHDRRWLDSLCTRVVEIGS